MKKCFLLFLILSFNLYSQVIVNCKTAGDFNCGLAPVNIGDKWGFINTKGELVIKPLYDNPIETPKFSNGFCAMRDASSNKWGFIDTAGNVAVPFTLYNNQNPFTGPVNLTYFPADASGKKQARQSLFTIAGIIILEETPTEASYKTCFKEGMARIKKNGKYGYMNELGLVIIDYKYQEVHDFSNGLAAVKSGGNWGFINKAGEEKVPFVYSMEPKDFSCGRAFVQGKNSKWGVIDSANNLICQPAFDETGRFSGGYALVKQRDGDMGDAFYSIIDTTGKVIKSFKDKEAIGFKSGFYEGLAVGLDYGGEMGFIDTSGKRKIDFVYSALRPFNNGLAYAEKTDSKTNKTTKGFIDKAGKFVIVLQDSQF